MSLFNVFQTSLLNNSSAFNNSYILWKLRKAEEKALLEIYMEKMPFEGNFSIVGGISEIVDFVRRFKVIENEIKYLRSKFKFEEGFLEYLKKLTLDDVAIHSFESGTESFENEPFLILQGPIIKLKIIQYAVNILLSYSSLICTNSVRMKLVAGFNKTLLEFGLRRAQGPMSGMLASKYSLVGGFNSTSNVYSGLYYNIPIRGTIAHAFIMSYQNTNEESYKKFCVEGKNLWEICLKYREELGWKDTNLNELASFISFTYVYPKSSLLLVDTYNTIHSGVKNFLLVALALKEVNIQPIGIRLDSGDLALISKYTNYNLRESRRLFIEIGQKYNYPEFKDLVISASNDINEISLQEFNQKGHEIDTFGIGTNLVTCQAQPFLKFKQITNINNIEIKNSYRIGFKDDGKYNFCFDVVSNLTDIEELKKKIIEKNLLQDSININNMIIDIKIRQISYNEDSRNLSDVLKTREKLLNNLNLIREKIEINNRVTEKIAVYNI